METYEESTGITQSSSNGYTCPKCGQWIWNNQYHTCITVSPIALGSNEIAWIYEHGKPTQEPIEQAKCPGVIIQRTARQMGYTIAPGQSPDVLEEKEIPCPLLQEARKQEREDIIGLLKQQAQALKAKKINQQTAKPEDIQSQVIIGVKKRMLTEVINWISQRQYLSGEKEE